MLDKPQIPSFEYPDEIEGYCSRCDSIIETDDMFEPSCNCISEVESMSLDEYSDEYESLPEHVRNYFSSSIRYKGFSVDFFHSVQKWVVSNTRGSDYNVLKGFDTKEEAENYLKVKTK